MILSIAMLLTSIEATAFSSGSPICEVAQLPLVEMSPTLSQPPPNGWRLSSNVDFYTNTEIGLQISHPDPGKRVKGVLIWAKASPQSGSGRFQNNNADLWQYIPAPAQCGEWALSHRDSSSKTQSQLTFQWQPGGELATIFRAFVIEDCSQPSCRSYQALSNILTLEKAIHRNGFE